MLPIEPESLFPRESVYASTCFHYLFPYDVLLLCILLIHFCLKIAINLCWFALKLAFNYFWTYIFLTLPEEQLLAYNFQAYARAPRHNAQLKKYLFFEYFRTQH